MKVITSDLINILKDFKDDYNTWQGVSNATGIPTRTLRSIRNDTSQEKISQKNYNKIMKTFRSDIQKQDIVTSYPSHHTIKKYTEGGKGFPAIDSNDFAYKQNNKYYAGKYSNKATGKEISKATYNRIRAGSQKQIRKINKAKHFLMQYRFEGKDKFKKAYGLANDWVKEYRDIKNTRDQYAWYSKKSGRWHLGKKGSEITGKRNGSFLTEKEAKKLRGEVTEGININYYLDREYSIDYIKIA